MNELTDLSERSEVGSTHSFMTPSVSSANGNPTPRNQEETVLAVKETKNVNRSKYIAIIALALAAFSISLAIYLFVKASENSQFEDAFESDSTKVITSMETSIRNNWGVLESFATSSVTLAKQMNQTWPFVMIPGYAIKSSKLLSITHGFLLSLQPMVTHDLRRKWETYSIENQVWVNETKKHTRS